MHGPKRCSHSKAESEDEFDIDVEDLDAYLAIPVDATKIRSSCGDSSVGKLLHPDREIPLKPKAQRLPSMASPTLLASFLWCQYQTIYSVSSPLPRPTTVSMAAGASLHDQLEKETLDRAGIVCVDVNVRDKDGRISREDVWGTRWWNASVSLGALAEDGVAREVPVLYFVPLPTLDTGSAQNPASTLTESSRKLIPLYGIVDQITRHALPAGGWTYVISDTKTVARLPTENFSNPKPNISNNVLGETDGLTPHTAQLSLYKAMWDGMVRDEHLADSMVKFCQDPLGLDVDKSLGEGVLNVVRGGYVGGGVEDRLEQSPVNAITTLRHLLHHVASSYASFPPSSSILELHYVLRHRSSPSVVSPDIIASFPFPTHPIASFLRRSLLLLSGVVEPVGVPVVEVGKCRSCEFKERCEWRWRKAKEAMEVAERGKAFSSTAEKRKAEE
ncbi:hypothetical protein HDU93_002566 [Gonapodya sp. JEL0774]|nr:hypothetical protein HDU93_002566 [Gonapodya sp. JEL0774]